MRNGVPRARHTALASVSGWRRDAARVRPVPVNAHARLAKTTFWNPGYTARSRHSYTLLPPIDGASAIARLGVHGTCS